MLFFNTKEKFASSDKLAEMRKKIIVDLGKPSIKKRWKLGICPNLSDPSPPLAKLRILNCYFFIAYLGFTEHEMDFDTNLFFCHTKVDWYLEKFRFPLYITTIIPMQKV